MAKADNHEGTIFKTTYKNGNVVYRCRIFVGDSGRKYVSASAPTQRDARAKAKAKYKLYLRQQQSAHPDPKKVLAQSVSTVMEEFLKVKSVSENWKASSFLTRQQEAERMYKYVGNKKIAELSASICNKCLVDMLEEYNRNTVRKCRNLLQRFIHNLYTDGIILEDFSNEIVKVKVSEQDERPDECLIFTGEEMDKIKDLATIELIEYDKTVHNLQYKALVVYLLFLTGMRPQEMRALTIDDVDFTRHRVKIDKARSKTRGGEIDTTPKTKHSKRVIGINYHTENCFHKLIELQPFNSKYLCITEKGTRLTARNLLDWFDTVLHYADVVKNERSVRALRHTFISLSIDKDKRSPLWNKSIPRISRYVSTTLDIYTQVTPNQIEEVDYDENKIELVDIEYELDDEKPEE